MESVDVDLKSESATVNFDPQKISLEDIKGAVWKAGYTTEFEESPETQEEIRTEGSNAPEAEGSVPKIVEVLETAVASETTETLETADTVSVKPDTSQTCSLTEACRLAEKDSSIILSQKTGIKEITLGVSGMTCSACALNIEKILKKRRVWTQ